MGAEALDAVGVARGRIEERHPAGDAPRIGADRSIEVTGEAQLRPAPAGHGAHQARPAGGELMQPDPETAVLEQMGQEARAVQLGLVGLIVSNRTS